MAVQTSQKWNNIKFKDFLKLQRGFDLPKQKRLGGTYPIIASSSVTDFHNEYKVEPPVVTTGRSGALGGVLWTNEKAWPLNTTLWVKDFKSNVPKFCYYLLKTLDLGQYNAGGAVPTLNRNHLDEINLSIPDVSIQKKIADVLSVYDNLIENNNRRVQILERIAQKIYTEWFVNFRFPGYEKARVGKGGFPEGWEEMKLDDCIFIYRGKSYSSEDLVENEKSIPFVNLKCIKRFGGFRKDGVKTFSGSYKEHQKVQQGDLVMAVTDMTQERMIVARPARISHLGADFGVISMDLVKIEPKENCEKDFLYAYFRWSDFADNVKNHANGANVLHLTPNRITDYKLICPPIALQQKYSELAGSLFDEIDSIQLSSENLQKTRDLLIPQLVTGKLKVKI